MKNFFDLFAEHAMKSPDKVLLRIDDDALTYQELMNQTARIASGMKALGIGENDKVGIIMPNSIAWYLIFWSAVRIGAQPVPIDPQSGEMELSRLIPAIGAKVCFIAHHYRSNQILSAVKALVSTKIFLEKVICMEQSDMEENEIFLSGDSFYHIYCHDVCEIFVPDDRHVMSLACTSGSTDIPKILSVPYTGFVKALVDMGDYLEFTEQEVMMIGMTLYHQGGFGMGLQTTVNGGTVIYQPQFEPITFLETVEKYHVSVIQLTSTLAKVLLTVPDFAQYDISSVRICYFAGEVLPKEIADIFVKKLGIRVINIIGSSETATMVVWDSDLDGDVDPSDFRKLPFTDAKVMDTKHNEVAVGGVGELCVFTDGVIMNYYGNEALSKEKILLDEQGRRWFCTGDLVYRLPDGRFRFAGRSKRIIKRGGNLVHAEEVEAALLTYDEVAAAAVTAQDHPIIGQQIIAYIQPKGKDKITRGELARYFDGKLSSYKLPDKIILVDEIPKDIGKIQYKYLRQKEVK